LRWPDGDRGLRVTFLLKDGNTRRFSIDGPWAMFRAVNDTGASTGSGSNSRLVTFSDGRYYATFRVSSSSRINPFLPGLLDKYRCRASL
jgi:type VI protein secretion system component VasK